jgi:DNA invertase Pin-like site-specific DNA recombinase
MEADSRTTHVAYIRISDERRQGQGASLDAQRHAIAQYAERKDLRIGKWVEERETAAATGRPLFTELIRDLRAHKYAGLILHKIDRGARNLDDWTDLERLADRGIDVRFATEDLDLRTVAGRLSADMQAVVAVHYIRNLREEALKGIRARLRAGIYPFRAPLGYLDQGAGKVKIPDPAKAPLILKAFQLYDEGRFGIVPLREEVTKLGLRNLAGKPLSVNGVNVILRNPFYCGVIRIEKTAEVYAGGHEPIVPVALFERVQARLDGRLNARTRRHDFKHRRLLKCQSCGYSLIGETRKQHIYYRCHTRTCPKNCVREETADAALVAELDKILWSPDELVWLRTRAQRFVKEFEATVQSATRASQILLAQTAQRLDTLLDVHLDGRIDEVTYNRKKEALELDRAALTERLKNSLAGQSAADIEEFLGLVGRASSLYKLALPPEQRRLVEVFTSDRRADAGKPVFTLAPPFREIAERLENRDGGPQRDAYQNLERCFQYIADWFLREVTETHPVRGLLDWFKNEGKQRLNPPPPTP